MKYTYVMPKDIRTGDFIKFRNADKFVRVMIVLHDEPTDLYRFLYKEDDNNSLSFFREITYTAQEKVARKYKLKEVLTEL